MLTVEQFYAETHLGTLFGVHDKDHPTWHHGVDFKGWSAKTQIPSWTAGTVAFVAKQESPTLGYLVIIRRADGLYAGFCHMYAPPTVKLGQHISVGNAVGLLGNTGSESDGAHLHATLEPQLQIGTDHAIDPLPYIRAARDGFASEGGVTVITSGRTKVMQIINRSDRRVQSLSPGAVTHLGGGANVVGGAGPYSITVHAYGTGAEGDYVDACLSWVNGGKSSDHYIERCSVPASGEFAHNFEFKHAVVRGDSVLVKVTAGKSNKGTVVVSVLDSNAYRFA